MSNDDFFDNPERPEDDDASEDMSFDWEDGEGEGQSEEHTGVTGELNWKDAEEAQSEERTGVTGMLNWQSDEDDESGEAGDDQSYGFAWHRGQEFEELLDAVEAASYTSPDEAPEPESSGFEWATGEDDSFEASEQEEPVSADRWFDTGRLSDSEESSRPDTSELYSDEALDDLFQLVELA